MERKGFKEWFRKKVVYLKRNTRVITMFLLIVTSCVFAFKMSLHSEALSYVTTNTMAIVMFATTLASFMSIFSFIAFKRFNKKSIVPLCMTLALLFLQVSLDVWYVSAFNQSINTNAHISYVPIMKESVAWMQVHLVFLFITIASIPLLPVISRLLGLINVTVNESEPDYLADGEVLVDELVE